MHPFVAYHWWRSKRSLLSFFKATIVCVCVCVLVALVGGFIFLCKLLVYRWEALHKYYCLADLERLGHCRVYTESIH